VRTFTDQGRAEYQPQPCPSCGNPVEQGWVDVTLSLGNLGKSPRYALGRWDCRRPGCRERLAEMNRLGQL
jgi:hypothetical protein